MRLCPGHCERRWGGRGLTHGQDFAGGVRVGGFVFLLRTILSH